jgi:UDP:flavonoid glycosyltransferase YjiC (YdhE family)
VTYRGPVERSIAAAAPDWPAGPPERIFAFLEANYPHLEAFARALAGFGLPAILYVRDLAPSRARSLAGPSLRIATEPIDFDAAARAARLIVCHGGHGTVSGSLRAGVPLLVLSRQAEQELLGYRIARQKLGITFRRGAATPDFTAAIRKLLDDPASAESAQRFAARHAGHDIDAAIGGMADACEAALLDHARPAPAGVSAGGA